MQKKIYPSNKTNHYFIIVVFVFIFIMLDNIIHQIICCILYMIQLYQMNLSIILDEKGVYKKWLFFPKKLQYHYDDIEHGIHTKSEKTSSLTLKPKNKLATPCTISLDNLQNPDKLLQDIAQYIPIQHETEKSNPVESEIGSRPLIICIGAFFLMFVSLAIKSELLQGFYLYREVWQWFLFWIIVAIIANYFFLKRDKKNQYVILTSFIVGVFSGVILSDFNLAFGRYICEKNCHHSQTITLKLIEQNDKRQHWQISTTEQNTLALKKHDFFVYPNEKQILKPNLKNHDLYQVEIYQTKLGDFYFQSDIFYDRNTK